MLRKQNLLEGGEGKKTRMSNQATRKNVIGLLLGMGKVLKAPAVPSINPFFSGS